MTPVNEFFELLDSRTATAVVAAERRAGSACLATLPHNWGVLPLQLHGVAARVGVYRLPDGQEVDWGRSCTLPARRR